MNVLHSFIFRSIRIFFPGDRLHDFWYLSTSVCRSANSNKENFPSINLFYISGTFAVISIMTAQAIENVVPPGTVVNGTDLEFMEAALLDQKIQAGTTLALLVGLVQVMFNSIVFLSSYYLS